MNERPIACHQRCRNAERPKCAPASTVRTAHGLSTVRVREECAEAARFAQEGTLGHPMSGASASRRGAHGHVSTSRVRSVGLYLGCSVRFSRTKHREVIKKGGFCKHAGVVCRPLCPPPPNLYALLWTRLRETPCAPKGTSESCAPRRAIPTAPYQLFKALRGGPHAGCTGNRRMSCQAWLGSRLTPVRVHPFQSESVQGIALSPSTG